MGENIAIIYSANKISFSDTHPAFVLLKVQLICLEFALIVPCSCTVDYDL